MSTLALLRAKLRGDIPIITEQDAKCASRVMTIVTDNMNTTDCDEDAIRELLHDPSLEEAIALEIADSRELALIERVGESIVRWVVTITCCALIAMIGSVAAIKWLNL